MLNMQHWLATNKSSCEHGTKDMKGINWALRKLVLSF